MESHSLYLHIPFCTHRCGYCDFNTFSGIENLIPQYVDALIIELKDVLNSSKSKLLIHTIYFGGGTPSLLTPIQINRILKEIRLNCDLSSNAEITLEVNPGSVDFQFFVELIDSGVNRLSFGVQSANPNELLLLEREHGFEEAKRSIGYARDAGFKNISVDLIYGLPYQTLSEWQFSVKEVLTLNPEHISLYSLTIEHGTPLEKKLISGEIDAPDIDVAAEMYDWIIEFLAVNQYSQYEISNWGKKKEDQTYFKSLHNIQYWKNLPYLGIGAGAHGFAGGIRTRNVLSPPAYIERAKVESKKEFPKSNMTVNAESINPHQEMQEFMMMGFRLIEEGISESVFQNRFNKSMTNVFDSELKKLLKRELIEEYKKGYYRLTRIGRNLGNQVFIEFV